MVNETGERAAWLSAKLSKLGEVMSRQGELARSCTAFRLGIAYCLMSKLHQSHLLSGEHSKRAALAYTHGSTSGHRALMLAFRNDYEDQLSEVLLHFRNARFAGNELLRVVDGVYLFQQTGKLRFSVVRQEEQRLRHEPLKSHTRFDSALL